MQPGWERETFLAWIVIVAGVVAIAVLMSGRDDRGYGRTTEGGTGADGPGIVLPSRVELRE